MGFVLFIVAIILTTVTTVLSMVVTPIYYIITFRWISGFKTLDRWFYKMALGLDQFGNISNRETLQVVLAKKGGHKHGDEDDTVSYVIGRNKYLGKLTRFGKGIERILNLCESRHVEIAIEKKIIRDKEASERIKTENYWNTINLR